MGSCGNCTSLSCLGGAVQRGMVTIIGSQNELITWSILDPPVHVGDERLCNYLAPRLGGGDAWVPWSSSSAVSAH